MTSIPATDYKIHCLEKENERLIESVKLTRQNALALVAAVLFITSGILNVAKPLVSSLNDVQYEGALQERLLGKPQSAERIHAVRQITCLWNFAVLTTVLSAAITIAIAVFVFTKSGSYAPRLDNEAIRSMSTENYLNLLTDQYEQLTNLNKSYRIPLTCAAISSLVAVAGWGILTVLWLGVGGS